MSLPVDLGADAEARKAQPVTLDPAQTASQAWVVVATECIEHWRTNEALLMRSRAMPHLHQTRVGIRRLRSSFSLFRPLLGHVPGAFLVAHRLRALALPFGAARDLDVLITGPLVDDLDDDQVARLAADREAAYDAVRRHPGLPPVGGCRALPRRLPAPRAVAGCRRPPGARAGRARPARSGGTGSWAASTRSPR